MFEFLKKFNFVNNRNDKVKRISSGSNNGVNYICDSNITRKAIKEWIKIIGIDNLDFSELLYELGFDKDRCLLLELISSAEDDKILFSFQYEGEVSKGEKMEIGIKKKYSSLDSLEPNAYKILISVDDYEKEYCLMIGNSFENGRELYKERDYIKEDMGLGICQRVIGKNGFRINIKNDFYDEIVLVCNKRDIVLKNEIELKEYLISVDDSVSIREIYKKICEISLGNEEEYETGKVSLTLQKNDKIIGSLEFYNKFYKYIISEYDYKYELLEDGKKYFFTYDKGMEYNVIFFKKDNYSIKIEVSFDFKLDDVIILRDYFMNLEFPVKINEICKDFRDKFLVDLNNINYFKIETYKDNKYGDNLFIKNGKVNKFEMTIGDKKLRVDKDGRFYYSSSSSMGEVEIDMSFNNDDVVTRYEISFDKGIVNENMGNVMYSHINKAVDEKVRVRKMFDEFLKKENN